MPNLGTTFRFADSASTPTNAVALIYDLEGFSTFFNQPDSQDYVPVFLNRVSEAISRCLFGGEDYWSSSRSTMSKLSLRVVHEKFMGDGALYIIRPAAGVSNIGEGTLTALCNRLWNLKANFNRVVERALEDVPVTVVPKRIRFGLSRGAVYELRRSRGKGNEFIGFCVNQASRLQNYCPDLGFIASARLRVSKANLEKSGYRRVVATKVKGFPDEIVIVDSREYESLEPGTRESLFREDGAG